MSPSLYPEASQFVSRRSEFKPLPKWRVMQLYPRAARGDQEAFDALLSSVLGLVLKNSRNPPSPYTVDEAVEMGLYAFVRSVANRRWNPRKGAFSTYVMFYILGVRHKMWRDMFPRSEGKPMVMQLEVDKCREPMCEESRSWEPDEIDRVLDKMSALSEKETWVIEGRFLRGRTLKELGKEMKLSRERVRQIEARALDKLRRECGVAI